MKSPLDKGIVLKYKDRYAYWSLIYLLIMLLFSGYVEVRIIWHITILVIGTLLLIAYPGERRRLFGNIWMIIDIYLCLSIIIFSTWLYERSWSYVMSNLRSMGYSLFSLIIIAITVQRNDRLVFEIFNKCIVLLNVMLIVNTIVAAIQARGMGFLIKDSWLIQNPYYDDQVAGLFGFNATSQLGMYAVWIMLLNFSYANNNLKNKRKRIIIFIYTIIMQALMILVSKYNDNAGYYIVVSMFAGLYMLADFVKARKGTVKKITKFFKYMLILMIAIILFFNISATKDVLNKYLRNRVEAMLHFNSVGMTGSNERLYQVRYGLLNSFGWMIGKGFGTAKLVQANAHGFMHFGICSMGAYIILLGIWFFLAYTLLYTKLFYDIVNAGGKKNGWLFFTIFGVIIIFTLYLSVFNDARSIILLGFYAIAFRYMNFSCNRLNVENSG